MKYALTRKLNEIRDLMLLVVKDDRELEYNNPKLWSRNRARNRFGMCSKLDELINYITENEYECYINFNSPHNKTVVLKKSKIDNCL